MKKTNLVILSAATLMLAACGNTTGERAVSGGAIGAGAGAVGTAITGGNPWAGAAIGGAAGAVVGAVTDRDQIDLNR